MKSERWGGVVKTMRVGLPSCLTGLKSLLLRYAGAFVGLKSKPLGGCLHHA